MKYGVLQKIYADFEDRIARKVIARVSTQVLGEAIDPNAKAEEIRATYDEAATKISEAERDKLVLETVQELEPEIVIEIADSLTFDEANDLIEQFGEAALNVARGNQGPKGVNAGIVSEIVKRIEEKGYFLD